MSFKIGFDISQTASEKAGCGFYADTLAKTLVSDASKYRIQLYPSFGDFYFDPAAPSVSPYQSQNAGYGPWHASKSEATTFWLNPNLEKELGSPDLIHANNFWCPLQLKESRLVYTLYDLGFTLNPSWTTEANRLGCFDGVFNASLEADWILAISDFSRNHFLKLFPYFPAERVRVIYPQSRFVGRKIKAVKPKILKNVQSDFWLSVGTIEPRKNQQRLVDIYRRYLDLEGSSMPLVFAGGRGWLMDDFAEKIDKLGLASKVIFTGYVSDAELVWLYENCFGNLYPSEFEGYGLPILEGMHFGAPTLASNTSSMPEIVGDSGILLDPKENEAWVNAMLLLDRNRALRGELGSKARERSDALIKNQDSEAIFDLYQSAISTPKRNRSSI